MVSVICNPGTLLSIEGNLTVAGERVYLEAIPLDFLIRSQFLQELEHAEEPVLNFGPTQVRIEAVRL
jgi:hypothetical protein